MRVKTFQMLALTAIAMLFGLLVLAACGGSDSSASGGQPAQAAQAQGGGQAAQGGQGDGQGGGQAFQPFQSAYLTNTYPNALPPNMQLIVGTFDLEGTPNAVTADEAKQLLPLYTALKGTALQNPQEIAAVLKQVEATMTPDQMKVIAAMKLTRTNMQDWAKQHNVTLFNGTPGPGGQGGQGGPNPQFTPDPTRQALRAELQNLSPEARATRLAELGIRPGQGGQGGGRFLSALLDPMIQLLTQRSGS